ncbi:MAG: class I SAM-dependent methyltransferase, partial [Gammaproteobacteria bacterium]
MACPTTTTSLADRVSVFIRDRLFDVSRSATVLSGTMYDDPSVSILYDTQHYKKTHGSRPLSTFRTWYELEFLDFLKTSAARSVLDVGCGPGAFYHLLESAYPGTFRYFGIDLSKIQIARAKANYGDHLFEVGDLGQIKDFSDYDAVHCWSVLSFMAPNKQIAAIERMATTSRTLIDTNFTLPRADYCSRSFYKKFAGKDRLTSVGFPYIFELPHLHGHEIEVREVKYAGTLMINLSENDSAIALRQERDGWMQRTYKR